MKDTDSPLNQSKLEAKYAGMKRGKTLIGFSFTSEWLRKQRRFLLPSINYAITKRSNAKLNQTRTTFGTKVKIT